MFFLSWPLCIRAFNGQCPRARLGAYFTCLTMQNSPRHTVLLMMIRKTPPLHTAMRSVFQRNPLGHRLQCPHPLCRHQSTRPKPVRGPWISCPKRPQSIILLRTVNPLCHWFQSTHRCNTHSPHPRAPCSATQKRQKRAHYPLHQTRRVDMPPKTPLLSPPNH